MNYTRKSLHAGAPIEFTTFNVIKQSQVHTQYEINSKFYWIDRKTCAQICRTLTYYVDHIGPMEQKRKRHNYTFVIVGASSKFVWLYSTCSCVDDAIGKLTKQLSSFGIPERIVSDRGAAFTPNAYNENCKD